MQGNVSYLTTALGVPITVESAANGNEKVLARAYVVASTRSPLVIDPINMLPGQAGYAMYLGIERVFRVVDVFA